MRARSALQHDDDLADDERVLAVALDIDPNICPPDEILRRMIKAIVFAEARRDEAKTFADQMRGRQQRYADRAMVLRVELLDIMLALERSSFAGSPFRTASVVKGKQGALITDEGAIPDEYKVVIPATTRPDMKHLLADLKEGVVIDGVVLSNGAPHLMLKGDKPLEDEPAALEVAE